MNLNAITLAISRPGGVRSWDPLAMFTSGVQGVWYDPSDLTTLYQDAAGTTPVTAVEQPVGLTLDKSKGLVLGSEKIVNGNGTSLTGWSNGNNWWTVSGGRFFHAASSAYNELSQTFTTTQGVKISFDYQVVSGVAEFFYVKNDNSVVVNALTGVKTFTSTLPAGIKNVGFSRSSGSTAAFYIDNISVRELPGNHAFNSSGNSANFPVLSARYNLLTKTEQFDDAAWTKTGATVSSTDTLVAITAFGSVHQTSTKAGVAIQHTVSAEFSAGTVSAGRLTIAESTIGSAGVGCDFTLIGSGSAGTPTAYGSGWVAGSATIQSLGDGWYRCTLTATTSTTTSVSGVAGHIGTAVSGNTVKVRKLDLRVTNDALNQPAYQRVNTATDYDTVGFKPYLRFNGTNQWLQTNSIDFTYGDKMFVSAGVRKLSDASVAILAELSTVFFTNNGTFVLAAPGSSVPVGYEFSSRGTANGVTNTGFSAPTTNVLSGIGNVSGDQAILRVNGTQAAISTANQGTGNYGNYPLYIGARAGTSLWFNGRLYGMVVAGKQASASEISSTETYLNQKTGAF